MKNEQIKKKGIITKIADDLKESTHIINEINKENFAAEKEAAKRRHIETTTPSPELINFKKAKGLKAKAKAVKDGFKESARVQKEKEQERREEIKNHTAYKNLLEKQLANRTI